MKSMIFIHAEEREAKMDIQEAHKPRNDGDTANPYKCCRCYCTDEP
jgi:hypothetical protein